MPFYPKSLAYQLRALFDAGACTPSEIARSCGQPVARVDGWLRGRSPDRVTELQVRKIVSYYARRATDRHLKLESDADSVADPAPPVRGILEVDKEFLGVRTFHLISAKGEKRLEVRAPAGDVNDRLMAFMKDCLNDLDPPISLLRSEPSLP